VVINGVTVARQPLFVLSSPVSIGVITGMHAPLRLEGASTDLCITPVINIDGTLFVPRQLSDSVLIYSADGTPVPPLVIDSVGLSHDTNSAAYDESRNTLLLADDNSSSSKLVAVDMSSHSVRWATAPGLLNGIDGIAVLLKHGIVFVSSCGDFKLYAHRLSDGVRIASMKVPGCSYLASDPETSVVYASSICDTGMLAVVPYLWNGAKLVKQSVVYAPGITGKFRPISVMPPAPGLRTSYLIVGEVDSSTLHIISLPDHRLVHMHTLEGMQVAGLAADPSGTALAVCDRASKLVHVLPWPLPGMPVLT
jgi:hypothetical protein